MRRNRQVFLNWTIAVLVSVVCSPDTYASSKPSAPVKKRQRSQTTPETQGKPIGIQDLVHHLALRLRGNQAALREVIRALEQGRPNPLLPSRFREALNQWGEGEKDFANRLKAYLPEEVDRPSPPLEETKVHPAPLFGASKTVKFFDFDSKVDSAPSWMPIGWAKKDGDTVFPFYLSVDASEKKGHDVIFQRIRVLAPSLGSGEVIVDMDTRNAFLEEDRPQVYSTSVFRAPGSQYFAVLGIGKPYGFYTKAPTVGCAVFSSITGQKVWSVKWDKVHADAMTNEASFRLSEDGTTLTGFGDSRFFITKEGIQGAPPPAFNFRLESFTLSHSGSEVLTLGFRDWPDKDWVILRNGGRGALPLGRATLKSVEFEKSNRVGFSVPRNPVKLEITPLQSGGWMVLEKDGDGLHWTSILPAGETYHVSGPHFISAPELSEVRILQKDAQMLLHFKSGAIEIWDSKENKKLFGVTSTPLTPPRYMTWEFSVFEDESSLHLGHPKHEGQIETVSLDLNEAAKQGLLR